MLEYAPNESELNSELCRISRFLAGETELSSVNQIDCYFSNINSLPTDAIERQEKERQCNIEVQNDIPTSSTQSLDPTTEFHDQKKRQVCDQAVQKSFSICVAILWEHALSSMQLSPSATYHAFLERINGIGRLATSSVSRRGYFIMDELLGSARAKKLYAWADNKWNQEPFLFKPGKTCNINENGDPVRSDYVNWIYDDGREFVNSLTPTNPTIKLLFLYIDSIVRSITTQLTNRYGNSVDIQAKSLCMFAVYPREQESVGYVCHYDNPVSVSDGRILTAIYYLNPDWQKEWGGNLHIYPNNKLNLRPSISSQNDSSLQFEPVIASPILDRLILFYSDERILHSVEPISTQSAVPRRMALTVWYFDRQERMTHLLMRNRQRVGYADNMHFKDGYYISLLLFG